MQLLEPLMCQLDLLPCRLHGSGFPVRQSWASCHVVLCLSSLRSLSAVDLRSLATVNRTTPPMQTSTPAPMPHTKINVASAVCRMIRLRCVAMILLNELMTIKCYRWCSAILILTYGGLASGLSKARVAMSCCQEGKTT